MTDSSTTDALGPIRIANYSGFYGDRLTAAQEMVEGGPIDVLTGDWLAELTMLILARRRETRPGGGFASSFVRQMAHVMKTCLDRGIKVVTNAGGLDPAGCAQAVRALADRLGLSPTIAYVDGDDLMPRMTELLAASELEPLSQHIGLGDPEAYLAANAYLGCWGIVDALDRGADIVVTGRVTDAAVVCGPAAWHHRWSREDWDELAGAVVAGHVLECSAQATGGNYSFFTEIPRYAEEHGARFGFPWADIAFDGSAIVGKHDGTGGLVSVGTVTSQLLYEIEGPQYLGPDVTARFDTIRLDQIATDRVSISGVQGEPPPARVKVGMNQVGGYRNSFAVALTGLDIEEKARLAAAAFWELCPWQPEDFEKVDSTVIRSDRPDPATNEEATAVWRLSVKDSDPDRVGRAFANSIVETALASIPGMYLVSGSPQPADPYGVYVPALIDRDLVPAYVHVDGETHQVSSTAVQDSPTAVPAKGEAPAEWAHEHVIPPLQGPTADVPLGRVIGARSGDKGGDANLGVFTRSDAAWTWLDHFLTIERLRELLPEAAPLDVNRYRLPNLRALNFVIRGLLQEGVAASTRQDPQAKSLGEWLRARIVAIPVDLLD